MYSLLLTLAISAPVDCPGAAGGDCDCIVCLCANCKKHGGPSVAPVIPEYDGNYHWKPIPRHVDCFQLWRNGKCLGWWDGREHGDRGAYFRLTDGVNGVEAPLPWDRPAPVAYYPVPQAFVWSGGGRGAPSLRHC